MDIEFRFLSAHYTSAKRGGVALRDRLAPYGRAVFPRSRRAALITDEGLDGPFAVDPDVGHDTAPYPGAFLHVSFETRQCHGEESRVRGTSRTMQRCSSRMTCCYESFFSTSSNVFGNDAWMCNFSPATGCGSSTQNACRKNFLYLNSRANERLNFSLP